MNRLKILIVEDEYLVRQLIKSHLNSNKKDFVVAGEASSALEAFEFIEENIVDIVITDINMPIMDGIEMAGRILAARPHIKVLAVTGYDDFEYAQKGIRVGIEDYLLKPVDAEDLLQSLQKIRKKLLAARKQELEYKAILQKIEEYAPALRESFFNELISNRVSPRQSGEDLAFLHIKFPTDLFQVAVVEQLAKKGDNNNEIYDLFAIKSILSGSLSHGSAFLFFDLQRRLVMLHCLSDPEQMVDYEHLKNVITSSLECTLSIGVSSAVKGMGSIAAAYTQAVQAMNCYTFLGSDRVIFFDSLGIASDRNTDIHNLEESEIAQLCFYIKGGLPLNTKEWLENCFDTDWEDIEAYRMLAAQIMIRIHTERLDAQLDLGQFFAELFDRKTAPEIKSMIVELATNIASNINNSRMNSFSDTLHQIEEYIADNLSSTDLSLAETARHFFMNASYLSRIFKQRKGISFRDYINKARIDKALEHLASPDVKAYEVGALVGIDDPNYFSTLFKKYTGMTITQYRGKI